MGRRTWLRDLVGALKDKASISKAALLSNPNASSLHLAVIRATTHEPSSPPQEKHVAAVLSYGYSSRITASICIEALMDRLQNTQDSFVAFKCLITVHFIIRRGSFILQDQLSVFPSNGGKNYLNLSNFRDNSSPEAWELSSWARWYARVLESLLLTSRVLGFFICSCSSSRDTEKEEERISAFFNKDLLRELDVLIGLMEEIAKAPELSSAGAVREMKLVYEALGLVSEDYYATQKEIWVRVNELSERVSCLSLADSVELSCVLRRLESCKERLVSLFLNKKGSVGDITWDSIGEMKGKINQKQYGDGQQLVLRIERGGKTSESARFGERVVLRTGESRGSSSFRRELHLLAPPGLQYGTSK